MKKLYLFNLIAFAFLFFANWSMTHSMEEQVEEDRDFLQMKSKFSEELTAYANYVDDACDYFEGLIKDFELGDALNNYLQTQDFQIKNFHLKEKLILQRLDKLSEEDSNFILQDYKKMLQEEGEPQKALFIVCMSLQLLFQKKISIVKAFLPGLQKGFAYLDRNNLDRLFLSLLSTHGIYLFSRSETLTSDCCPVFSVPQAYNKLHDRRRIAIEQTKQETLIDVLDLLYPFVKDTDGRIKKLLCYLPVLSKHLACPQENFSLDEYALDGVLFKKYYGFQDINKVIFSSDEDDKAFMEKTSIPIIDVELLSDVKASDLTLAIKDWKDVYKKRFETFLPSYKFSNTFLKGLESSAKKKKKRHRHKKPKSKTPILEKNLAGEDVSYVNTCLSPIKEDEGQAHQILETLEPASSFSPDVFPIIPLEIEPVKEMASLKLAEHFLKEKFAQQKEEAKRKAKIERDNRKECRRQSVDLTQQMIAKENLHPLLSDDCKFEVKGEDYTLLTSLLRGGLTATTSYHKIVGALKRLGISFTSRGNGDKRTMILPNGRRELIYYPATNEVGHRFLEKIRNALQEKWGLKEEFFS